MKAKRERKPYFVYVLELEDNNYYIGIAPDVDERYRKHAEGQGSEWTRIHKPLRIMQRQRFESWTDAAIAEDAATLWLMVKHHKGIVRGGRWISEGHTTVYGYTEAIHVMRNPSLTNKQRYERIQDIVVWTMADSWYWRDILERSPGVKRRLSEHPCYQRIPDWLKAERAAGVAKFAAPTRVESG